MNASRWQHHIDILLRNVFEHSQVDLARIKSFLGLMSIEGPKNHHQPLVKRNIDDFETQELSPGSSRSLADQFASRVNLQSVERVEVDSHAHTPLACCLQRVLNIFLSQLSIVRAMQRIRQSLEHFIHQSVSLLRRWNGHQMSIAIGIQRRIRLCKLFVALAIKMMKQGENQRCNLPKLLLPRELSAGC